MESFADKSRNGKIVAALISPAVLGALSGLVLGISAPVYWALQVLAVIGGLLAGLEHDRAGAGALRGLVGGTLFGSFLLLVHVLSGLDEHVALGDTPAFLIVITAVAGCLLGALGGGLRAHLIGRRTAA